MLRKRTWILGFMTAVLLTFTMGQSGGTQFSCSGSGGGTCTGDLCD